MIFENQLAALATLVQDRMELDFEVDLPLSSESGVSWTDQIVYLEGEIVGGVFQPLR